MSSEGKKRCQIKVLGKIKKKQIIEYNKVEEYNFGYWQNHKALIVL